MSSRPIEQRRGEPLTNVDDNGRLTALTGALLFVLLAALGVTILAIEALLPEHFLIGFLLIPPIGLKLASTGYRFMRYYTGDSRYRQAGPPAPLLRILAPFVVLSTVVVFATGLELWFFGLRFGSFWIEAHKLAFFAWLPITGVHVLAHLNRTGRVTAAEFSSSRFAGALTRRSLVIGSLVAGVVLAAVSLTYATPFVFFGDG